MKFAFVLMLMATGAVAQTPAASRCPDRDTACAARVQRLWSQQQESAMARRVSVRQQSLDQRDEAQYAANRQRCASALRIAELCGKHAGRFYCDARGFQPAPGGAPAAVLDTGTRNRMDRCVRDAEKGSPLTSLRLMP